MENRIGIIGLGNLGEALLNRLKGYYKGDICIYDIDEVKAKYIAARTQCTFKSDKQILMESDLIFLVLPPQVIKQFLQENMGSAKKGSTILNLSTSVDTGELAAKAEKQDVEIIGLKPVCQATALAKGHKVIFVSSKKSRREKALRDLLHEIGDLVYGDEMKVREINELVTLSALRLIIQLRDELKQFQVNEEILACAIRTVAIGTLMDYPYSEDRINDYIQRLIDKYSLNL